MRLANPLFKSSVWLLAAAFAATGCKKDGTQFAGTAGNSDKAAAVTDSGLTAIAAEKDSLLREVVENTRLMSDIAAELAKIQQRKKKGGVESAELKTTLSDREFALEKIKEVVGRINESEKRLAASQQRVRSLGQTSDSLRSSVSAFEATVIELQAAVENQKITIGWLNDQVGQLHSANVKLTARNAALSDTVSTLTVKDNTVYYVIGNKKELLGSGVVVEEGSKFLVFGKKVLQPARDVDAAKFTAVDKRRVAEIALPKADKRYRIISRQNLSHLASAVDKDGKLAGSIQIASAEEFWAPSKYLIVVEQ